MKPFETVSILSAVSKRPLVLITGGLFCIRIKLYVNVTPKKLSSFGAKRRFRELIYRLCPRQQSRALHKTAIAYPCRSKQHPCDLAPLPHQQHGEVARLHIRYFDIRATCSLRKSSVTHRFHCALQHLRTSRRSNRFRQL